MKLLDGALGAVKNLTDAAKHSAAAVGLLDVREAVQMKPATLERAGRLAETMLLSGFEEAKVKQVIRALFCTHLMSDREAEQQMERAFDVWDDEHTGVLELSHISHSTLPSTIRSSQPSTIARKKLAELQMRLQVERVKRLELENELENEKRMELLQREGK